MNTILIIFFSMMIKKESDWASELSIQKRKISKLENQINDMKKETDRKLQQLTDEYEQRLEVNRKQHEEELRMTRGLSGSKLISDAHHEGNTHTHACVYDSFTHDVIILFMLYHVINRQPRTLSKVFRLPFLE
jgi:predicted HAD superfamily hydrolase